MKKASFFIIIILLVLIGAGCGKKEEANNKEPEQILEVISQEAIPFGQAHNYKLDSAEFIIYAPDFENYDFGYFEVYNNGEIIYTSVPSYAVLDLLSFETKDGKYVVVSDYSGGAHCCFTEYIFFLNKQGKLKIIKDLFFGDASIREDSLILKNNSVYIKAFDDRFAYFYTPFAGSYFFIQYLKVQGEEIKVDNTKFGQDYIKEAERCEVEIESILSSYFESYSPMLVCIAVNYMLANQEQLAWQKVEDYFKIISLDNYGQQVEFKQFKQEFLDLYNLESFSAN